MWLDALEVLYLILNKQKRNFPRFHSRLLEQNCQNTIWRNAAVNLSMENKIRLINISTDGLILCGLRHFEKNWSFRKTICFLS